MACDGTGETYRYVEGNPIVNALIRAVYVYPEREGPDEVAHAALYDYLQEHPEQCPGCSGTKRTYHHTSGEDVTCWVCEAPML